MCVCVCDREGLNTNTILWAVLRQKTLALSVEVISPVCGDSVGQGLVALERGRSDDAIQTMEWKWNGSGLKLSGCALAQAAGVGTFSCPVLLTLGVIRACSQGAS